MDYRNNECGYECTGRRNGKSTITRLAKELANEKIWGIAIDISCNDVTDEVISFVSQMAPKFGFVREYDDNHPSILRYWHKERYDLFVIRNYIPCDDFIPGVSVTSPWPSEGWR